VQGLPKGGGMLGNMGRFNSPLSNMPKPNLSKIKISGKIPGKKVGGLGSDPIRLMKRFFLYKNMFGEGGGKIPGLNEMGQPMKMGSLVGGAPKKIGGSPGDIQGLAAARRLGII
jgi:hypothetical protein